MTKTLRGAMSVVRCVLLAMVCCSVVQAQSGGVTVRVSLERAKDAGRSSATGMRHMDSSNVVVWLTALDGQVAATSTAAHETYRLVQKDKQFIPHVLVVPAGSSVEFPNLDPFFHNVFSLFNGKRFDLGLYEAGSRRSVRFDREGVSYVFCNIHPEMGAVVVALRTPWYAMTAGDGVATMRGLPPGEYRLNVWAEDVSAQQMQAAERIVRVESAMVEVEPIRLTAAGHAMDHTNKFGEPYKTPSVDPY